MGTPADYAFPKSVRLLRGAEFSRVLAEGQRGGDRLLQIWALPNDLGYTRLGLIVGRRHGNAVRRNRIKRVLREAFRLSREQLPAGLDLACAPRAGTDIALEPVVRSLRQVTARLARRCAECPPRAAK
jgi:ribonuclease P protein component